MTEQENDGQRVAIVGAGPAGLALAIELGSRSIPCIVLERNSRQGYAPRAKTTHTRTREHLRRWGIADKLAEASPFGVDYPSNVLFVTRLAGPGIERFENALYCAPRRDERYSEHAQWIPQYKLEAVLMDHARSLATVEIAFGQDYLDFEQDDTGVRVRVRDIASGVERIVEAAYLVGADGARSVVRDQIGAKMIGTYGLSRNYNTIFEAPGLAEAHGHGPGIMYWQINEEVPSLIGPMDQPDLWYFMPTGIPEGVTYSEEETLERIRRSTGIDLPYRLLSSDEWVASRLLADRYALGRVFLTGDACHLHPPFGGYGMNMGVADSVDLGWKIAAVLQGWGDPALLDSYEIERRPAHEFVMDEAEANHAMAPNQLVRPGIEDPTLEGEAARREVAEVIRRVKTNEFYGLGVVLGYCYARSPVIVDDGTASTWRRSRDYVPSAVPGCLAPHHWLEDGRSLYDLFGSGFTLLAFDGAADADIAAARDEAARSGIPLEIVELRDPELGARYEARLALIRPDQHVAWRGDTWPAETVLLLAPVADMIGRRRMVMVNLLLMMTGMLMSAFSHSIGELSAWRVITGLGIGSMVPIITPLAVEFANARRRALSLAIMSIGYPIGGTLGGFVAAILLHWFDWPAVFLFGAVLALVLLVAVACWLPEPLAFLVERRDAGTLDRVNALLARFGLPAVAALPPPPPTRRHAPYREIFSRGRRAATLRITLVNLLYVMTVYYVLSWMPQMVADSGFSAPVATMVSALASLGGIVACILVGIVAPRVNLRALVAGLMIGLGIATPIFGFTPPSLPLLALMGIVAGAFLYSGITGLYALIVDTFEPRMRATGVGFVMGIGRASGAIAPLIAGTLFSLGAGRGEVSAALGAAALLAGLIVYAPRGRPPLPAAGHNARPRGA